MPGRGIISSLRAGPPAGAFLFAFLQKPFRGTGWGLRAPTPAPTLSGKSRQKAAARRLRQKPLNAGLGRGDAQSAYFGRGLGLPLRLELCGVRPNPRAKPAGVFACASYCRCWEWTAIRQVDTKKKPCRRITRDYAALLRISNGVRPFFISMRW